MNKEHVINYITQLKEICGESYNEKELSETVGLWLNLLGQIYKTDKSLFSDEEIEYLKTVRKLDSALGGFINILSWPENIKSMNEFNDLVKYLHKVERAFEGMAIKERVKKKLKEVYERYPKISERELAREKGKNGKAQLKRDQEIIRESSCPDGHPVILRRSRYGYSWGCRMYPWCKFKDNLTDKEERDLIRH